MFDPTRPQFVLMMLGLIACHGQAQKAPNVSAATRAPSPPSNDSAVAPAPSQRAPRASRAKAGRRAEDYDSEAYRLRLFTAFNECGKHDLGTLDGQWTTLNPPTREVWLCDGHIRWLDHGLVNDICISGQTAVNGGIDAEGAWHEDWHDPGDASGLDLYLREQREGLSVEAADWEEPGNTFQFFLLKRKPDSGDHPGMQCPIE